jgi:hypothetical protein
VHDEDPKNHEDDESDYYAYEEKKDHEPRHPAFVLIGFEKRTHAIERHDEGSYSTKLVSSSR